MKFFNFCIVIFCLLSTSLVAQEFDENPFSSLMAPDSVKITKRFLVKEPVSLLGYNSYISEGNGLDMPSEISYMDQKLGRSLQWGLGLVDFKLGLNGTGKIQKLSLQPGIRWNLSYYRFANNFQLIENAPTFEKAVIGVDKEIRKHRLLANYISIPVMLDFNSHAKNKFKSFRVSVGYVHSFLLGGQYKIKYEDKEKLKVKDKFNLNPSLGKFEARVGYGPIVLYFQYGLDGLFEEGKGPNVTPVSIGLVTGGI